MFEAHVRAIDGARNLGSVRRRHSDDGSGCRAASKGRTRSVRCKFRVLKVPEGHFELLKYRTDWLNNRTDVYLKTGRNCT
jgi:hypothetical protein